MKKAILFLGVFIFMVGNSTPLWCDTEALIKAIKAGDISAVRGLIRQGADLNGYDSFGWTPLYHAVDQGSREIVEVLLKAGADVSIGSGPMGEDETPLELALRKSDDRMVDRLLRFGADERQVREHYRRQLYTALRKGRVDIAESLLTEGNADLGADMLLLLATYEYGSAAVRDFIRKHGQEEISTGELNLLEWIIPGTTDFTNYIGPGLQFPLSTTFLHDSKNPFRYGPDKAFDADMSTSWVEGVEGNGIGQKLAFVIQGKPERILIVPGYGVEKYFRPNNRLKKAVLTLYRFEHDISMRENSISFESLLSVVLEFEDRLSAQSFPLAIPNLLPGSLGPKQIVELLEIVGVLEIVEIYQGSKYDDTCIAEIRFE